MAGDDEVDPGLARYGDARDILRALEEQAAHDIRTRRETPETTAEARLEAVRAYREKGKMHAAGLRRRMWYFVQKERRRSRIYVRVIPKRIEATRPGRSGVDLPSLRETLAGRFVDPAPRLAAARTIRNVELTRLTPAARALLGALWDAACERIKGTKATPNGMMRAALRVVQLRGKVAREAIRELRAAAERE